MKLDIIQNGRWPAVSVSVSHFGQEKKKRRKEDMKHEDMKHEDMKHEDMK
jgi:hypothetical protein